MKIFLVLFMSVLIFASFGLPDFALPETDAHITELTYVDEGTTADSLDAISGTWYSLSSGMMIRFQNGGTADLGLDTSGAVIGYQARAWYEGSELFLVFDDYDRIGDENDDCATAVGVYEVFLRGEGNMQFSLVRDDCPFRVALLSGQGGADFGPLYQSVLVEQAAVQ